MRRLSFVLVLVVLLLGTMVTAGCGGDGTTSSTTSASTATTSTPTSTPPASTAASTETTSAPSTETTAAAVTPKSGGIFKLILAPSLTNAGGLPWELWGPQTLPGQFVVESLFNGSPTGELVPWLAKSYELAPDKMSVTVALNQGIKFHDGSELNADVVKWNIDQYIKAGAEYNWKSAEVVDPYTVKIDFTKWANINFTGLRDGTWIISKDYYEKNGEEAARNHPVGTGPFKFVSFEKDVKYIVEKNPDYWVKGKPYLDGAEILFVVDPLTEKAMLESGEADCIGNASNLNKLVKDLQASGIIIETHTTGCWALTPDAGNADSPYKEQKVREAVEYAIDREGLAAAFSNGMWEAPTQIPSKKATIYNANPPVVRNYDPEKAKQLLTEAGYPNGFKTTLLSHPQADKDEVAAIQAQLKAAGIDAQIVLPDNPMKFNQNSNTLHNALTLQPCDAIGGSWNVGFYYLYMNSGPGSGLAHWLRSADWVKLYEASLAPEKEDPALEQAVTDQWTKEASVIPVFQTASGWYHTAAVKDGGFYTRSYTPWITPWNLWLDK